MGKEDWIRILGIRVDNVSGAEAEEMVDSFIRSGLPHQVVTVNPEFIMAARRDEEFAAILNAASLALPDGVGLVWASRFLGMPLKERVAGVDCVWRWAKLAAERGYRLFLLGAAEGVAEEAASGLKEFYPELEIAGTFAGSPAPGEEEHIVGLIRQARPHLLFVAYGAPEQDRWIHRNLARLEVPVAMGVGGAFDFISGRAKRAPRWVQRLGLEWLHRLFHEPWRWRRMLALPQFAWLVIREERKYGG